MFREKNVTQLPSSSPPFWVCVESSKGKPAIYWPPALHLWLFIPGIWPEAGDESFSQSATIRSTEISDVSPAACCSAPLAAHLILIFLSLFFFFPPTPPTLSLPKLSDWFWVVGFAWADGGQKEAAGTDPNTWWIIPEIHIRSWMTRDDTTVQSN